MSHENKIYVADSLTTDLFKVVSYDLSTGEKETIYEDEKYDLGAPETDFSLKYDMGGKLVGLYYERDKMTSVWFSESLKGIQAKLDKAYPNNINTIWHWTADYKKVLFNSWNEKTHGRVIIYTPEDNKMIVQTQNPPVAEVLPLMANTSIIKIPVGDASVEIEGYLSIPASEDVKDKKLIVMPHGGPFARSSFSYNPYVQYFTMHGYYVLEPNFRGSVGYGREFLTQGIGSIHDVMISDIAESARWVVDNYKINKDNVYIYGASYGGYAAILSALKYPDFYAAAASFAAPLDIAKQLKWYKKNDDDFSYHFWKENIVANRKKSFVKSISPIHKLGDIKIPVLIFHGDKDSVVPVSHAEAVSKIIKKKKYKDIEVKMLKDERHGIRLDSNKIYLAKNIIKFFDKN